MSSVLSVTAVGWTGYGVQHALELIRNKRETTWQTDFLARFKSQSHRLPRTEEITTEVQYRGSLSPCRESSSGSPEFDSAVLLLLLYLSSSSSSYPLFRVFILIFLRQTMSLGNTVLQLFCCYYQWRTEGGGVLKPPSAPRNSEDPQKSCQIQPDCENC
jgi:hypothetical protein